MAEPSSAAPLDPPSPLADPDPTRYPNTRARTSTAGTSAHDGSLASADLGPALDPDTCRICRAEATPEEPLFYPCRCSGSIKFVHKRCLMGWLAHSQKKHCELCMTPFRFTKLYRPDMPSTIPFFVFIKHTAKYTIANILVCMRAALVASVWLGWLPYLMRSLWSFLFWLSERGLGGGLESGTSAGRGLIDALSVTANISDVCPSSPLFAPTTTAATMGGVVDGLSLRLVKGMHGFNFTSATPLKAFILRLLFGSVRLGNKTTPLPAATASPSERLVDVSKVHPSFLSDVAVLRNLTRNATLNSTVIDTLEGQIITILVVACFVLIILVRDYVLQNQPDIVPAGAFVPAENALPLPVPPAHQVAPPPPAQEPAPQGHVGEDEGQEDRPVEAEAHSSIATGDRFTHWPREDHQRHVSGDGGGMQGYASASNFARRSSHDEFAVGGPTPVLAESSSSRSNTMAPGEVSDSDQATSQQYSALHRETGGDSSRSQISDPSSESALPRDNQGADRADVKGKGKAVEEPESEGGHDASSLARGNALRPRAKTDGPLVTTGPNRLGSGSWSFEDLGGEGPPSSGPVAGPSMNTQMLPGFEPPRSAVPSLDSNQAASSRDPLDPLRPPGIPNTEDDTVQLAEDVSARSTQPEPSTAAAAVEEPAPGPPGDTAQPPPDAPAGLLNLVTEFMFRDVDAIDPEELAAVPFFNEDLDDDDDGADVGLQGEALPEDMERDREAVGAAEAAGLDREAIEDAEELEGILDFLGMHGHIAVVFQNAIFCAFLVFVGLFLGIFIPYNFGRLTVWMLANPRRLARILFSFIEFIQDCVVILAGVFFCLTSMGVQAVAWAFGPTSLAAYSSRLTASSSMMAVTAANRIGSSFLTESPIISGAAIRHFSAISHEALLFIGGRIALVFNTLGRAVMFFFGGDYLGKGSEAMASVANISAIAWGGLSAIPGAVTNPSSWVINLNVSKPTTMINPELAFWNGPDRVWAIMSGYLAMSCASGLYLRRGAPFSSGRRAREWENSLLDALNQASGITKVILIIGIEMLAFPLYCGILLDIALLPLFKDTTVMSRLQFALNSPVTSIFVHWFVGTGYMFHFALFVSMCRKIMRKGVLYFIRDPDDPDFHPVRHVLSRSVATQLRKILFSALVYGTLILVCLGGVVWGLALFLPSVLPIHYSSNDPVLEFPVDLLFYNFLMPLAVSFFRPSDGLHAMYTWWFRKCARVLRISWFLFGERLIDEEGHLHLQPDSPHAKGPWWKTLFLEIGEAGDVVPKTWGDLWEGGEAEPTSEIDTEEMDRMKARKARLVRSGELVPDGRFVRTPASDQVKIPKGQPVFLEVDENNVRRGREVDLYSSNQYQLVYVPPNFRTRILALILLIWLFAAATGVGMTIVPLVFGRRLFKLLLPSHIRTNDIYAFSIGVYVLSTAIRTLSHLGSMYAATKSWVSAMGAAYRRDVVRQVVRVVRPVARVLYAYFFLFVVFPLMVASLMEVYTVMPLHELMYGNLVGGGLPSASATTDHALAMHGGHTVRVVQSWTIGLLYLKLASLLVVRWCEDTRLAAAILAVLRRGWLDPDVSILTRAFVVPGLVLWAAAVMAPVALARFLVAQGYTEFVMDWTGLPASTDVQRQELYHAYVVFIHRLSFPCLALLVAAGMALWSTVDVFRSWQVRIRDDAYLIGQRLHNFVGVANVAPISPSGWRGAGARQ